MARIPLSKRKKIATTCIMIYRQMMVLVMEIMVDLIYFLTAMNVKIPKPISYVFDNSVDERFYARLLNIRPMIQGSDVAYLDNLRMDRACFNKMCEMLRDVGKLQGNRNTSLKEIVALFLFTLSHDTKNRRTQLYFGRSGKHLSQWMKVVKMKGENGLRQTTTASNSTNIVHARWSLCKDRALLTAMNDLVDLGGWKTDNGQFTSGANAKLETLMKQKLLRKKYDTISEMLSPSASGLGWNDKGKFVTCPQSVWDEWIKSHKNAIGLRNKPFPFFEELGKIFGKDRAVGNEAENRVEEVEVPQHNIEGNSPTSEGSPMEPPPSITPSTTKTKKART
ncbi:hypothetical protein RDABS01_009224 [Bienertia sinuspersici]